MKFNKLAGLMAVGSAVALFGSVAQAQLTASPTASDDMGYTADVAMQCAVDTASAFTQASDTAQAYAETTGTINAGLTRVVQLEASDTIGFDCNSDAVDLTVIATDVTGPAFSNATDIDLLAGTATIGVDHVVDVAVDTSTTDLVTNVQALVDNTTIVSPATGVELVLPILQLTNRSLRKNIMLKHIYIETSIPSLYYDIRTDAETVARTHWTQNKKNGFDKQFAIITIKSRNRRCPSSCSGIILQNRYAINLELPAYR